MTPSRVLSELEDFLRQLLRSGIALYTTKVIPRHESGGFQRITWAANTAAPGHLFRRTSATVSEYRQWVLCQGYSALLFDGSFIQMSYDFNRSALVGHRLVYFPCPFDLDEELIQTSGLFEVIDLYQDHEIDLVRLRSPVRFDYHPTSSSSSGLHPASHMTFQSSDCRIPVMAPISPGHFIRFVFKSFYPSIWSDSVFLQQLPKHDMGLTISADEKRNLHFNAVPD